MIIITFLCQQALADVVACNRNPSTGMVEALDAWNAQFYRNIIDTVQDVQHFSGTYSGGRIRCRYIDYMNILLYLAIFDYSCQCC